MLFKCEPFDTFLAVVGVGGWVGGVFEMCFARKKKKKKEKVGVELTIRVKAGELLWTLR